MLEVGFIDTPEKFAAALASIDNAIAQLGRIVDETPDEGRGINDAWRLQWHQFVRRWELERDEYGPWLARAMLLEPNARMERFRAAYLWWAADFEKKARRSVPGKAPAEPEHMSAALMPDLGWMLLLGLGIGVYAFAKGRR